MNDNDFLAMLGREARRQQEAEDDLDSRYDALAAGELTEEEEKKLRQEAAESRPASDACEAFRPLGQEFRSNLVDRIHSELVDNALSESKPRVTGKKKGTTRL